MKPAFRNAGLFSLGNGTSFTFRSSFLRAFGELHSGSTVVETEEHNTNIYQTLDNAGELAQFHVPKPRPDTSTRYDRQHILLLEDEAIVREAGTLLFEKHPAVSSLYVLENGGWPKLVKGNLGPLTEESRLVLVGHGRKMDGAGKISLGMFGAKDVAEIVSRMSQEGKRIKTTSVVACKVGADEAFRGTLLRELRARSVETELHTRTSLLQVSHSGQKVSVEVTPEGLQYRHRDPSKKVVDTLGSDGRMVSRVEPGDMGEAVYHDQRNFLGKTGTTVYNTPEVRDEWKLERINFEDKPQGKLQKYTLQWFDGKADERAPTPTAEEHAWYQYVIKHLNPKSDTTGYWMSNINNVEKILKTCRKINTVKELVNEIHHQAKYGDQTDIYYNLHDWIYKVNPKTLYVYLVGRKINIDSIKKIVKQVDENDYEKINWATTQLNREDYVSFTKETLQGKYKTGTHSLEKESWLADYFMASIFSESVRNFRTFPDMLMCLQGYEINEYKQKFLNYLFEKHPMARGGTWVSPNRRGFHGASSVKDSSKLYNLKFRKTEAELQKDLDMVFSRESAIWEMWKKSNLIDLNDYFDSILPASGSRGSTGILGGSDDGAVTLRDLHSESGVELSLELSAYHARSQALLTQQIQERLQQDFGKTAGDYRLEPGSVQQEDGQFRCRLSSLKEPTKSLDWHLDLNPVGLRYTEKILEKCHEVNSMEIAEGEGISAAASPHQALKHVEHAGKAVAVVGVTLGLQGAMRAFEEGDIEHGTVALLQTMHGVAGMILGMIAKRAKVLTSKPAQVMVRTALKKAFIVMPLVGIVFGIYNIKEDFERKDILGYIDAGLDITMLGLDVVELLVPEVAPFLAPLNLALSVLRMVVDYVYMGIQAELDKLPEDADFLDKLDAVLCGVTMGIEHLSLDVLSFFYTIPYREIEEGQTLVEKISDYRKYYTFQKEEGGRKAIDFNGGEDSWNGGNITFCLSDDGWSKFCMDSFVSSKSRFGKQCWELETDKTTQDIILGIGESHHLQYRSVQLKVFMFIPANIMEVISGYEAESHTRFGKYYGNQAANNFFTVQNPDDKKKWEVMLSYYYQLYGENGDDTFFLGPQKSYVEGRAGRDTYIIPETGGNVIINNYHPKKTIDVLMLKVNYSQISVSKSGPDVILSYLSSHHVRIQNWFTGEAYRHLQMISSDGVLFDIPTLVVSSPRLVAQGVNKMSEKRGQEVDVTQPLLQTVTDIFGSSYNDRLIGNDQNNLIDGGGGRDYVKGGEGEDIYVVKNRPGTQVQIENFSVDKKTDLLLMESRLHDLRARVSGNDLVLFSVRHSDSFTLLNWFRSENSQHLLIVTEDFVTLTLANNTDSCRVTGDHFQAECLLSQSIDYSKASGPQSIDMEQDEVLQKVKEVRGSDFDDKIWGNARDNGLMPGRGSDVLAGRNGADWYMVTPAQGLKTISNYASDLVTDMLFIKERYGNIEAKCEGRDLVLYVNGSKDVVLERWFEGRPFQHLQVQTADGFRFALAANSSACLGFVKIPLSIDFRERGSNGEIMKMDEDEFASVVEMHGSRGFDVMIGNGQDNVLDPGAEGTHGRGGRGGHLCGEARLRDQD
ncbi:hypothetical protein AOXY_G23348 [Acipenser oxyrinchus oxyrinchus]|uniref:Peptidase C80 domain-containing protein n=1 Tax=Acipenser oxyrinchus oxyrinchus TaxID=40147 RepID=A0AAD8CZU0_ACIOX|nr:hypothetical protein AOXY_G23348 [Acipenser oxyrinchus oxyrinchus]